MIYTIASSGQQQCKLRKGLHSMGLGPSMTGCTPVAQALIHG